MTEINTFSALLDDCIVRSGRPDRRADMVSYARQTMRECQVMAFFQKDFTEDSIVTTASPHIWTTPQEFRQMRTVRYGVVDPRNNFIYPKHTAPGRSQRELTYYYYRGVDYFVFSGLGLNVVIDLGYYSYMKKLPYYTLADRPATFSLETNSWSYLTAADAVTQEAARLMVSNWLLFDWYDLLLEGCLAKVYKTVSDQRAASTYGLYKSLQKDLLGGEAQVTLDM